MQPLFMIHKNYNHTYDFILLQQYITCASNFFLKLLVILLKAVVSSPTKQTPSCLPNFKHSRANSVGVGVSRLGQQAFAHLYQRQTSCSGSLEISQAILVDRNKRNEYFPQHLWQKTQSRCNPCKTLLKYFMNSICHGQ